VKSRNIPVSAVYKYVGMIVILPFTDIVSALETTVALKGDASPGTAVSSAL